jgi:hypothetical protein
MILVVRPKCDNTGYALAYAIKKAESTVPSEMAKVLRSTDNLRGATGGAFSISLLQVFRKESLSIRCPLFLIDDECQ